MMPAEVTRTPLASALQLAEEIGLPVFPCRPRTEYINGKRYKEKSPLVKGGFFDATRSIEQISEWWRRWPDALIGVPMGKRSGLCAIDVDPRALEWYGKHAADLAAGRVHKTRRGFHLLYRHREGFGNTSNRIADGIDTRGDDQGYIIWWPAHVGGAVGEVEDVGELPDWVIEKCKDKAPAANGKDDAVQDGIGPDRSADLLARVARDVRAGLADYEIVPKHLEHPHAREQTDPERAVRRCIDKARASTADAAEAQDKPEAQPVEILGFTLEDLRQPVREERYLLPGLVPTEAYSLIAGALSSYKSNLLLNMLVWRATGFDLLGLHSDDIAVGGVRIGDPGPCVLCSYEDTDWRIFARLQRILLAGEQTIRRTHGSASANEFLELAVKNIRRVPLTGKLGKTLVARIASAGYIVPNHDFIEELTSAVRAFTSEGVLIGLDPLRLAIAGSQNDDDGADITVQVLNSLSVINPGSGLLVAAHTTKQAAKDNTVNGYADAAYATSGSALYSQHARSNFHLARLGAEDIRKLFGLETEDCQKQTVARLTHGRLSHGLESREMFVRMEQGLLVPIAPRPTSAPSPRQTLDRALPIVAAAANRLGREGVKVSGTAIAEDPEVRKALGPEKAVRTALKLLEENKYMKFTGTTKNRTGSLTTKGLDRIRELEATKEPDRE